MSRRFCPETPRGGLLLRRGPSAELTPLLGLGLPLVQRLQHVLPLQVKVVRPTSSTPRNSATTGDVHQARQRLRVLLALSLVIIIGRRQNGHDGTTSGRCC